MEYVQPRCGRLSKSDRWASPIFFVLGTLGRTWGTRPIPAAPFPICLYLIPGTCVPKILFTLSPEKENHEDQLQDRSSPLHCAVCRSSHDDHKRARFIQRRA